MFPTMIFLLAVVYSFLVHAVSPPDDIILIRPFNDVTYNLNATVTIGVSTALVEGLQRSVNITVAQPHEKAPGKPFLGVTSAMCESIGGVTTSTFNLTQGEGIYSIFWNVTYGYPSNATANGCGNSTFSYQNWLLNENFTVEDIATNDSGGGGGAQGGTTSTAALPSPPTGTVISVSTGGAVPVATVERAGLAAVFIAGIILLLV